MKGVRHAESGDLSDVVRIHNSASEAFGGPKEVDFFVPHLADERTLFLVFEGPARVNGFLLGFKPGAAYRSPNYEWFLSRIKEDFLYIDRFGVGPASQKMGIGTQLYEHVKREWPGIIAAETAEENYASRRFHRKQGFDHFGRNVVNEKPNRMYWFVPQPIRTPPAFSQA